MCRARLRSLIVVSLVTAGAMAAAQSPAPPIFRVGAELVVVDLVATDREGRFVADLQPGDIQVFEDGKPQKVEFVTVVRRGAIDAAAGAALAASDVDWRATGSATDATTAAGDVADAPKVVIVVDLAATPADAIPRVREAIASMLTDEWPEGPEVMFATLWQGLTVHQAFTRDRMTLKSSVEMLGVGADNSLGFAEVLDASERLCDTFADRPDVVLRQLITIARGVIDEQRRQLIVSSDNLAALARSLANEPGRKHVVYYSNGYALNPANQVIDLVAAAFEACGGDAELARRNAAAELAAAGRFDPKPFESMIDLANRSQVSVYTIDPRGLVAASPEARQRVSARASRRGQIQRARVVEATLPQEFLRTLAAETGGRSFLNTNDLARGIRRAWLDANEYYLVGYAPTGARRSGRFHRIEVKVARPNLDLTYRRGYYASTERDLAARDVQQALSAPDVFASSGLEVEAEVDGNRLRITAFVPPMALRFTETNRQHVADLSLHAILRDESGRLVGGKPLFGRDVGLKLTAEQLERLLDSDHVEIPVDVSAPKSGTYRLTVVVRDSGGWLGAQAVDVTVER